MEGEAWNEVLSPTYSKEGDEPEFGRAELDALERVVGDGRAKAIRLSYSLLKHITKDFSTEIGRGGFANVYLGTLPNGSRIAVKSLVHNIEGKDDDYRNEVSIMMRVADHRNIVRIIGYCNHIRLSRVEFDGKMVTAEWQQRFICLEYVPDGTLARRISDKFLGGLDWNQCYHILKGVCLGLCHLHHEVHVVHGDIKAENILLQDNLVPKLFDFGLSRHFGRKGESSVRNIQVAGSLGYMAPELILHGYSSIKSDIFSFGIVIIKLFFGSHFLHDRRWEKQPVEQVLAQIRKNKVKEGVFSSWENKYQQVRTCLEIFYKCMDNDPDKRPTAFEIIQMLDKTESTNYSGGSDNTSPLWQSGDDESEFSDTDISEPDPEPELELESAEFPPSDVELANVDTKGETSTQDHRLSKLEFLEEITDRFSLDKLLKYDNTSALLYKGTMSDGTMVAVKRFTVGYKFETFQMEAIKLMSLDGNENIVKLLGYCQDASGDRKMLVPCKEKDELQTIEKKSEQLLCYEYMDNGSLRDQYRTGHLELDWPTRYKLIKGICQGLHYLHEGSGHPRIVHLNLNPSNVLLDKNNVAHITGFDISKLIGENRAQSMVFDLNGQIRYLPPEFLHPTIIKDLATVDIYSLGLMILEIIAGQELDERESFVKTVRDNWRKGSQITSMYTSLEPDKQCQMKLCFDIGIGCVETKPEKRPTVKSIIDCFNSLDKETATNVTHADDHAKDRFVEDSGPGAGSKNNVHARVGQHTGRKSQTTAQELKKDYTYTKIYKALKKFFCNCTVVQDSELEALVHSKTNKRAGADVHRPLV